MMTRRACSEIHVGWGSACTTGLRARRFPVFIRRVDGFGEPSYPTPKHVFTRALFAAMCVIIALAPVFCLSGSATATELGTKRAQFTIDGKPSFLFGISYYGALGAPAEFVRRDLDDMQKLGINWIRVWATWGAFDNDVTAVDDRGMPREPYMSRLKALVAECDRRGMIVDVTLSRGNRVVGPPRLQSFEVHQQAVLTFVSTLKPYRNWYLDLGNERNIQDKRFVDFKQLAQLRDAVTQIDPKRLVTASYAGDIGPDDLEQYLRTVRVDFICPHRPRNGRSPKQTAGQSRQYAAQIKRLGRVVPLHYQEPFRRGFTRGWEPTADDYLTDAAGAYRGGAAGWCLHNGDARHQPEGKPRRSFDMRQKRLFEQLDDVERTALERVYQMLIDAQGAKP